jgi:hypothetical protein
MALTTESAVIEELGVDGRRIIRVPASTPIPANEESAGAGTRTTRRWSRNRA